jgi:hydroxyethylthiazole kinase-like uncharacterized protein yjeF
MKAVTAEEMRRIDEEAIGRYGIPASVLMAYAGRVIANYLQDEFPRLRNAAVCCGAGNNGGDGFVVAYLLANSGWNVKIYFAGAEEKLSDAARTYFALCRNAGVPIESVSGNIDFSWAEIIVDALLGTGFSGTPREPIASAIAAINASERLIVSIDVPSGLPSDGQAPEGKAVFADITVSIGLPKISLVTHPGKRWAGKLVLADIGFPRELTSSEDLCAELIDEMFVRSRFPVSRDIDAHKNSWEHVLFVGGFDGMEGALILAASAFFEAGAGIATALTTEGARNIIAGKVPELMTASFATGDRWYEILEKCNAIKDDHIESVIPEIRRMLADFFSARKPFPLAVIGPGMGRSVFSQAVCMALFEGLRDFGISRAIIDGDGLYHFAEYLSQSKPLHADVLITPHFLEASRICGKSVDDIRNNRFAAAGELSRLSKTVVLLKGPASIISDGVRWRINTNGNPALATAGSGDVLCGIIASIASRNIPLFEAASIGAWLHGAASDIYVQQRKKNAMKARDIIVNLPEVLRNFS